jgi:hypothetical protein
LEGVTMKKIPLGYQKAIKRMYGRQRILRVCQEHSISSFPLLKYINKCYSSGISLKNLRSCKFIPVWVKEKGKLEVEGKEVPFPYAKAIAKHYSMKKAKEYCSHYDLDPCRFVKYLEVLHEKKVCLWDLGCHRLELPSKSFPDYVYLDDANILPPVLELPVYGLLF